MYPLDQQATGSLRLLLVGEERDPTRQVRVLAGDKSSVAAMYKLDCLCRSGIDPPRTCRRNDHENLALEGTGPLQFFDDQIHAFFGIFGTFEPGIDANRIHRRLTGCRLEFLGIESTRDEVAPLEPQGVPGSRRFGATRFHRILRFDDAVASGRVLQTEDRVGRGVDSTDEDAVDQHEEQNSDDQDADTIGDRPRPVEPPHQLSGNQFHQIVEDPPDRDEQTTHEQAQSEGSDVARGGRTFGVGQRRDFALPPGRVDQHDDRRDDGCDRNEDLDRGWHRLGQGPPPSTAEQVSLDSPTDRGTDAVTDGRVDAADQTLEQPISR